MKCAEEKQREKSLNYWKNGVNNPLSIHQTSPVVHSTFEACENLFLFLEKITSLAHGMCGADCIVEHTHKHTRTHMNRELH